MFPKKVEFGQSKVPAFPEETVKQKEVQKEAAQFVYRKSEQTLSNAIQEGSSTNVVNPAAETVVVAESLTQSLGKPEDPWKGSGQALAARLDKMDAKYDKMMLKFKDKIDDLEGKKVEGTGIIQMSYFSYLFFIFVLILVGWMGLKVVGTLSAPVGIGTSIVSGGVKGISALLGKATSEIVKGGQAFKERVDKEFEDPEIKAKINDIFVSSHKESQSTDVQNLVKQLKA